MPVARHITDGNTVSPQPPHCGRQFNPAASEVAPALFSGLFTAGSGGHYLWNTPSWSDFISRWTELTQEGLRLRSVDTLSVGGARTFVGAWGDGTGDNPLWRFASEPEFVNQFNAYAGSMQLVSLDVHASDGQLFFTGAWQQGSTPQILVHGVDWYDFTNQWQKLSSSGMRLTNIQVYPAFGEDQYIGVFTKGAGAYALLVTADWNEFQAQCQENRDHMELVDFQVYDSNQARWYIGAWRETQARHLFLSGLDWGSFTGQWASLSNQGYRLQRIVSYANTATALDPDWNTVLQGALGPCAAGFSYVVARNGTRVASGAIQRSRSHSDSPETNWTQNTRVNIAGVSKSVTAVAVLRLLADKRISLDSKFYPYLRDQFPQAGAGVDRVSIRDLLCMKSGLTPDATLTMSSVQEFLSAYLDQPSLHDPGKTYEYSNASYTILQAVIEAISGKEYVAYVTQNVLLPMGINPAIFNANPEPQSRSPLSYSSRSDTRPGAYWPPIQAVAAAGWISSPNELIKFLVGVRSHTVLTPAASLEMLNCGLGWYTYDGAFGQYYHSHGSLLNELTPPQGLSVAAVQFPQGYDAILMVNSWGVDATGLLVQAFETRSVAGNQRRSPMRVYAAAR